MRSKPVVDGLERDLAAQARVLRLDMLSATGRTVAQSRNVELVPTFLVVDGQGRETARFSGADRDGITRAVRQLSGS